MKKLLSVLMCVSLLSLSFYSCSDDDDNDGLNRPIINVTVKASYDKDGIITPDAGSTVYIFEGLDAGDPNGKWKYSGNGYFTSETWERTWNYSKKATIGTDGTIKIANVKSEQGKDDEHNYYTIVIESFAHKDDTSPIFPIGIFNIAKNNQVLTYQYGGGIVMGHE